MESLCKGHGEGIMDGSVQSRGFVGNQKLTAVGKSQ